MKKIGLLLLNLGTPDDPGTPAVARYLNEFLMDPGVINIPFFLRWPLVKGIIVPRRAPQSAAKYQKIWSQEGSPLFVHTKNLADKLRPLLRESHEVEFAMRYGNPSIAYGLKKLAGQGVSKILLAPLYPQYAAATTGSSLQKVKAISKDISVPIEFLPPFYAEKEFVQAWSAIYREKIQGLHAEHTIFTFHGLPESQIKAQDCGDTCLSRTDCCDSISAKNANCYRAQCFASARAIASDLQLAPGKWSVSFQSRFGRAKWISPYTDKVVEELAEKGIKKIAVLCPAFTADCLETLEEIGMEVKASFQAKGGEDLYLAPCLNDHPVWVEGLKNILLRSAR